MSQRLENRVDNTIRIQASFGILKVRLVLLLKYVRQAHGADLEARVGQAIVGRLGQDMRAKTADGGFLDRNCDLVRRQRFADHLFIKRFGKAGVGHRR